jgi:hypothetical protein
MGGDDSNTESTGKSAKSYGAPGRFNGGDKFPSIVLPTVLG